MSKFGQKDAVIAEVLTRLPGFQKNVDNALTQLSSTQLEDIKTVIYTGIINGHIEYSKDITDLTECRSYARSMVMNHLKKAKELNGGVTQQSSPKEPKAKQSSSAPKGVNLDLLPEDLRAYAKTLV